ncbi:MAG: class D sortase, partial [Pseudomonadota bacterium]
IDQWEEAAASGIPLTRSMLFLPGESVPVPIFAGTSDHVMDLGAGQLTQFSNPGEIGNFVVAAHRDGFFRSLKDIEVGDELRAIDRDGEYRYRVDDITIVEPSNVDVLASDGGATITLVTCYPFYFQGSAPNRFIVRGSLVGEPSEAESPAGTATVDPFASAHDR